MIISKSVCLRYCMYQHLHQLLINSGFSEIRDNVRHVIQ